MNKQIETAEKHHRQNLARLPFDLLDLFEAQQAQALGLQQQIAHSDREIDRMVYALYGLTEEEIRIVEVSHEK